MKRSLWMSGLFLVLFTALPHAGHSAIAKQQPIEKQGQVAEGKAVKHWTIKEKIGRKFAKIKQRVRHWKEVVQMAFPSGKLLASLVFLLLSIVFFAVAGVTTLGVLFNSLGSAAVIAALVLFILWLSGRNSAPSPAN